MLFFRKRAARKKVNALNIYEKEEILDNLIKPFGYEYESTQDIFMTRQDAPQKLFGYTSVYDHSAPYFNMVYDYETIYFDYNNRTWLVEMWKGQYGINTGCELGIYYADVIVPPEKYATTHFQAAHDDDNLLITLKLNRHASAKEKCSKRFGQIRQRHWWPCIFKMGEFSKPDELFVNTSIRFRDYAMLRSFMKSFTQALPSTFYKINGRTVYFTFSKSERKYSFCRKMIRCISLVTCHLLCKWFNHITRVFCNTGDKLLYIYYYMPFVVRLVFRQISHTNKKSGDTC